MNFFSSFIDFYLNNRIFSPPFSCYMLCVCIYFSDSGNNSNIFFLSLYGIDSIAEYGRVLVCYQLVNKPHDWINVLQDIWEDNVTIIIFFFATLSHEIVVHFMYLYIYHNHYRMPFVHRFILHSTKHLLFFYISSFFVVYIKLLILPPQAFFWVDFGSCCVVMYCVYERKHVEVLRCMVKWSVFQMQFYIIL